MRDTSPEDRAKRALFALDNTICRTDEDEMRVLASEIREAVEAARAEEREACARLCEEASELSRKAANEHDHDDFRCRVASSRAHAAFMLAEKIRARGKETPRG